MPLTPTGPGLPTNLINQVIVTQSGMVLVATTTGLAWSTDHGHSFSYVRGQDYVEKVKGLAHPPKHFNPNRSNQPLLLEDYITALGEETEADPQHPHAKPTGPSPPPKSGSATASKATNASTSPPANATPPSTTPTSPRSTATAPPSSPWKTAPP